MQSIFAVLALLGVAKAVVIYPASVDFAGLGGADVYDSLIVWDDDSQDWCNRSTDYQNACDTDGITDGESCSFTYTGVVGVWNGQEMSATFNSHDSGFGLTGATLNMPGIPNIDVSTDGRCQPYKCTSQGAASSATVGFRCVFDV